MLNLTCYNWNGEYNIAFSRSHVAEIHVHSTTLTTGTDNCTIGGFS